MRFRTMLVLAAVPLAMAACQTAQQSSYASRHQMLVQSGFTPKPADAPNKVALMNQLPPNQFVQQTVKGKTTVLLADPTNCNCVYMGDASAYSGYRGLANVTQQMEDPLLNPGLSFSNVDNVSGWDPM
ncbi:MAG: hypothetical protein U1E62_24475 [Alsobacter sp.]